MNEHDLTHLAIDWITRVVLIASGIHWVLRWLERVVFDVWISRDPEDRFADEFWCFYNRLVEMFRRMSIGPRLTNGNGDRKL